MATSELPAADYRIIERDVANNDFPAIKEMIDSEGGSSSATAALCLVAAARAGNNPMLGQLLDLGVPVDIPIQYGAAEGETALMQATEQDMDGAVDFLLQHGAKAGLVSGDFLPGDDGHSALVGAVYIHSVELTRKLLEAGADPNAAGGYAIQLADQGGEVEIYQLLIAHGGREIVSNSATNSLQPVPPPASTLIHLLGPSDMVAANAMIVTNTGPGRWRVAVIADDHDAVAADMLTASLTKQPGLDVLERGELNRILNEQKLSWQFAATETNAGPMAELLHADALIFIRQREVNGTVLGEYRLALTHPGIIVDSACYALPVQDVNAWAGAIGGRTVDWLNRFSADNTVALSLLEFSPSLSNAKARGIARTLDVLLRDRLMNDRHYVLLERNEMDKLAFEAGDTNRFRGGSFMVAPTLDLALDQSEKLDLDVRFRPFPQGNEMLIHVTGTATNLMTAVDALKQLLDVRLSGHPAAPLTTPTPAEADYYLSEARWALEIHQPEISAQRSEAAWNLGLQSAEVLQLRLTAVLQSLYQKYPDGPADDEVSSAGLDIAGQAVALWQEGVIREDMVSHPDDFETWLELLPGLENAVIFAITKAPTAHEKIRHAEQLEELRQSYWSALNEALTIARQLPAQSDFVNRISLIQARDARLMLSRPDKFMPVLEELFQRHYATNDMSTRCELRAKFTWDRIPVTNGNHGYIFCLPRELAAKKRFLNTLASSTSPEDRWLEAQYVCDREATILTPPEAILLMERFWGMRDSMITNTACFTAYYPRFHTLIENEPMGDNGYTPRVYAAVKLDDGSGTNQPQSMTQFEFRRRLYLYLLEHATRPEPAWQALDMRNFFSPDQKAEVDQAFQRYAARTGAVVPDPSARLNYRIGTIVPVRGISKPPLRVTRLWHPFDHGLQINPNFIIQPGGMRWVDGRIWAHGYVNDPVIHATEPRHYVFAIDPASLQTEVFPLPATAPTEARSDYSQLEVTPDKIFLGNKDFFAVCDRHSREWKVYEDLKPSKYRLISKPEGTFAYLVLEGGHALAELDLKRGSSRLLASTLRHPRESPLDDPDCVLQDLRQDASDNLWLTARSSKLVKAPASVFITYELAAANSSAGFIEADAFAFKPAPDVAPFSIAHNVTYMSSQHNVGPELQCYRAMANAPGGDFWLAFNFNLAGQLPPNRFGGQNLGFWPDAPMYACPAAYIIPSWPGPCIWFIPKSEFDEYLKSE